VDTCREDTDSKQEAMGEAGYGNDAYMRVYEENELAVGGGWAHRRSDSETFPPSHLFVFSLAHAGPLKREPARTMRRGPECRAGSGRVSARKPEVEQCSGHCFGGDGT
jgi:hypothetical protein